MSLRRNLEFGIWNLCGRRPDAARSAGNIHSAFRIPHSAFSQSAFTLIEVLVASAILAMLLVVFLSMSNYASQAWKSSQEKMEEFSTARVAMNRMRADFGSIILRPDLPTFPSDAEGIGFMTMTRGITNSTDVRALSYVEYYTNGSNQLLRGSKAYTFDDSPPFSTNDTILSPGIDANSPLAEGVIGFKTAFLNKSGGWSTNYSSTNSVGVRVSLLVISSERLRALDTNSLSSLVGAMESAYSANATNSPEFSWNEEIDKNTSGIDLRTLRSLRAFERLFFFPNAN